MRRLGVEVLDGVELPAEIEELALPGWPTG